MLRFDERCSKINDLNAQIKSSKLERINYATSYLEESVKCFHNRLWISCVVVSSALVERTLFWQRINFWREMKLKPPKAGSTMRFPNLGGLFKDFRDWDIFLNSLLDIDERLDLKLKKEKGVTKRRIERAISKARYVETRNLFAHGKGLLLPMPLTQLLPADAYARSEYGIGSEEWWNPTFQTIAYVHLSKTLRFVKAFTALLLEKTS
jgi:hypothetical protein